MTSRSDECPCRTCNRQGCGKVHDICEKYQAWAQRLGHARAWRDADAEIDRYFKLQRYARRRRKHDGSQK